MKQGTFRADLYYRLNVITMDLPPLREREEDIPLLAEAFLKRISEERGQETKRLASDALEVAMHYDWPGNVRELENALEHAIVLTDGPEVKAGSLPERVKAPKRERLVSPRTLENPTLETVEAAYIMWVLQAEGGNKSRAAEILGIDPSTLYRKLARYDAE